MKKRLNIIIMTMLIIGVTAFGKTYKIGSSQIMEHPALDEVRIGVEETLKKNNIDYEFDSQIAQGDMSVQQLIMQNFAREKKDYIIAISTPTVQAAHNSTKTIPVLFGAVTDPKGAGVDSSENITGISDAVSPKLLVDITKQALPNAKRIGTIYNPSEKNSETAVRELEILAKENGLELVAIGVTSMNEIPSAVDAVLSKVDVLYTLSDNLTVSASPVIYARAKAKKVPVIATEGKSQIPLGALAGIGVNYKDSGNKIGEMIVDMIRGESIKNIPIQSLKKYPILVNEEVAKLYNVDSSAIKRD